MQVVHQAVPRDRISEAGAAHSHQAPSFRHGCQAVELYTHETTRAMQAREAQALRSKQPSSPAYLATSKNALHLTTTKLTWQQPCNSRRWYADSMVNTRLQRKQGQAKEGEGAERCGWMMARGWGWKGVR